ncbi:hypothetical protein E4U54_002669 [Claviceps lovelessii]|nr:hypothetical protein E4U54_002669 [Claviceps lovelessii]
MPGMEWMPVHGCNTNALNKDDCEDPDEADGGDDFYKGQHFKAVPGSIPRRRGEQEQEQEQQPWTVVEQTTHNSRAFERSSLAIANGQAQVGR